MYMKEKGYCWVHLTSEEREKSSTAKFLEDEKLMDHADELIQYMPWREDVCPAWRIAKYLEN
jgi:hypothetical protein